MHNIILSNTISNHTIHHIISSNIIKWLTVIQTKWERERERERKRNTNRLREWRKERKKKRIRVREKVKILEERKTIIYQKYVYRGDTKIKKWRNKEKWKNSWKINKRNFSI